MTKLVEGSRTMEDTGKMGDVDPIQENNGDVEIIPPNDVGNIVGSKTKRDKLLPLKNPALFVPSSSEQAMLDVLLDPYHRLASVSRQCEIAGISRATYYRILQSDAFVAYYRDRLNDIIKAQGGQLINIGIREARKGSFPHWKVLMEMGGFIQDKREVSVDGELTMRVVFSDPDDDEE